MSPTVLITGASQGTGKATALLFARRGYNAILAARQPERLDTVASEVRSLGREALAVPTDVGNWQQVRSLVDRGLEHFEQIDVLVNNAGICLTGGVEKTSIEDWHRLMDTNFFGYVHTIEALLPHFLSRGRGAIVNVGSFGAKMPIPRMTAYCASKYAVTGLTESLRVELEPKGIHVGAVHPGVINSDFLERALFRGEDETEIERGREQMDRALQSPLVSQPEDIANGIWEVARDRKSEVVVGSVAMATQAYRFAPGLVEWLLKSARFA